MKCKICNKNEATVHFKQVCEGEVKEMYVCGECASQNGFDVQSPMSLTDFLFGIGEEPAVDSFGEDKICASCGMNTSDFRKLSRLGCASCYETFGDELAQVLSGMHKGTTHTGKVPKVYRLEAEVGALKRALDAAVSVQDFEEAALLRDRLNDLSRGARGDEPVEKETGS